MLKPAKTVQIFESPALEWFSRVHPVTPLVIFGPVVILFFAWGYRQLSSVPILFLVYAASGFVLWTVTEYCLHRFVFHFPFQSQLGKRFQFILHGNHHEAPDDPMRLVMPPSVSIPLAVLLAALFQAAVGEEVFFSFFGGYVVGYLAYDYIHYALHHTIPRTKLGRALKHHHMLHHFHDAGSRWGVSTPFWDWIFRSE